MGRRLDIEPGQKFNKLTIVREVERTSIKRRFLCQCDCGNYTQVNLNMLRTSAIKSCGCLLVENGKKNKIHGQWKSKLYAIWRDMKQRCLNPNNQQYKNYGGRGIKIRDEWLEFNSFYQWAIKSDYKVGLSIERKDVNGNYEPSNCTWIPKSEQLNNLRRTRWVTWSGETRNIAQWSAKTGLSSETIRRRLAYGWSIDRALSEPPQSKSLSG